MTKQKQPLYRAGVILLSALLLINLITLCVRITSKRMAYPNEYSSLIRDVEDGNYPSVRSDLVYNDVRNVTTQQSTEEIQALAKCQNALMFYKAYLLDGNTEKANEHYAIYQENAATISEPQLTEALNKLENEYLK